MDEPAKLARRAEIRKYMQDNPDALQHFIDLTVQQRTVPGQTNPDPYQLYLEVAINTLVERESNLRKKTPPRDLSYMLVTALEAADRGSWDMGGHSGP